MKEKKCSKPGCEKEAISFSNYCGRHTANRNIIAKLKHTRLKNLKSVYLDEVELKNITFDKKNFISATIQETEFIKVTFRDCSFKSSVFSNIVFTECFFTNCYFAQWDCKDVSFHETVFENCVFEDWQASQCYFGDDSYMNKCSVGGCEFIGGVFSDTGISKNIKFLSINFLQASFTEARFSTCQFLDSSFSKTSFYASSFTECDFDTITHDFKLTGEPKLCDFRNTRFRNMTVSPEMKKWNNFNKEDVQFYLGISDMLSAVTHPNYLPELAETLVKLNELGFIPNIEFLEKIKSHIKRLVQEAYATSDYRTLGNIMTEFGKIPQAFRRNTGFILPPAENNNKHDNFLSKVVITVYTNSWELSTVSRFLHLLAQLEKELPPAVPQVLHLIEKGSIIVEIWGAFQNLIAGIRSFVDLKNSRIDGKLKEAELQKKLLEIKKEEIELSALKETRKLEHQKTMIEIAERKLDILERLEKKYGFDYKEYLLQPKGIKAKRIGEKIKKEFPVLNIFIEE